MEYFEPAFFEMVRTHPESEALHPGARMATIATAEDKLGHPLPPSYREFLSQVNGGAIGGIRLFGMDRDDHLDFLAQLTELSSFIPSIEARVMIPFASDWGGSLYCFDTYHPAGDGEYPIYYWNHEYSEEPADAPFVWAEIEISFVTFMLKQFSEDEG